LPAGPEVPKRTFLRWLGRYRKAEATCGSGFLGLLPQCGNRGNRTTKLPETSRRLMQECIDRDYETLKQKTRYVSWAQLKLTCETQATPTPSYKTFCLAVRQRPASDQVLKRKGRRASYQLDVFSWELDVKTPRHGDRPFEIGHMDHTELDVECVTASGQALGRPWLTLLTDSFSRRTLAFYLTFDPPSYRSCMMVLRICVRWCEAFRQVEGETVPVRYDPFDAGTAYAFVQRQWLQCHSDCYGTLKGRSEREIMLATTELHRKHHNHSAGFAVTARHLAEFLQSVEAEEILLTQRLRDREQRAIRSEITTHSENSDVVGEQRALAGSTEHVAPTADDRTIGELYGEF